jgi:two-component system, OmpR family, response regulator
VAVVDMSFPTDLEKYMSTRLFSIVSGNLFPETNRAEAMRSKNTPRVLYIEDHEDTRELVTLVLEQRNYEIVTGSTIKSGLALANSQQFDLYLLDSWLPDGSGLDLCRQIREFDKVTPILFYSAAAYEVDKSKALNCGAQAYLIKPSNPSELCSLVTSLIETHRRRYHRIAV